MKRAQRRRERGYLLLEVLVTIVVLAIGLLGLAGLQSRVSVAEMEAYQRAQALILAQDMADRIVANKANAGAYVADDIGAASVDCTGLAGAALDKCQWGNALRGAAETSGGANVGTLLDGRGCITNPATDQYLVIVVWQGLISTAQPSVACGAGTYGADAQRRAVVVPVRLAALTA